ncbi:RHS repeat-associated core domain-containing protein [Xanthocytophaga agilis]|uniref:RHS repeat-associated core domain-containing protein n=1 Tax=Xanthocytophaga agilis TaxID=3048010 RepID=A0AAE3R817_9BACT|nr:RHS repeat-associated core domain-containing protein [Xanthocytophaga agilis]MDJ1505571.1 RHS repeat-associated core domain-containing protein [Xanthocytophaga agilis]
MRKVGERTVVTQVTYQYDAAVNRTVKATETRDNTGKITEAKTTYYVRDNQGNVLSVYEAVSTTSTTVSNPLQKEIYLYGSRRLGLLKPLTSSTASNTIFTRKLGLKDYELTDHLGDVRAVIGDYRSGNTLQVALKSYANYYAFGLEMSGMTYNDYRYGYNGKEKDKDFQNNYDYGFRIYNAAVGKFLSVDPLTAKFPWYTPYEFAGNSPIGLIDLEGLQTPTQANTQSMTRTDPMLLRQMAMDAAKESALSGGTSVPRPPPVSTGPQYMQDQWGNRVLLPTYYVYRIPIDIKSPKATKKEYEDAEQIYDANNPPGYHAYAKYDKDYEDTKEWEKYKDKKFIPQQPTKVFEAPEEDPNYDYLYRAMSIEEYNNIYTTRQF